MPFLVLGKLMLDPTITHEDHEDFCGAQRELRGTVATRILWIA
jgi:hypothetical protein